MEANLISVVIPVYRVEQYLRRCVDSVLAQTYTQIEVILVDDGSPDGCPAICDAYAREDGRVRVIHQKNAGLSGARNRGIEAAEGEWLAFVDSDDYLAPEFLERLYRACVDTDSEMSVCRWEYVKGEQPIPECGSGAVRTYSGREMLANLYRPDGAYFVVAWNKLYRRELIELHGLRMDPKVRWCEDFMFNLEYIRYAARFYALDEPVYYYVKNPQSLVSTQVTLRNTFKILSVKASLFTYYKNLYEEMGLYEENKLQIFKYLVAVAEA